ncbi:hypothetical protein CLV93_11196 [Prolixibacter denitrificans]|uniref:Uncharacterized protein n=2 Tax=Prolixibacter denitrificans TaxID=1541063 RepID=A0A2P8C825_9BACT|nr:hypothetical protein CLV93_11196 [Prolixibacter denitrificans]GET22236.1 hypothetical protein JCM18694_24820 [Prolixibacter denitrificans]
MADYKATFLFIGSSYYHYENLICQTMRKVMILLFVLIPVFSNCTKDDSELIAQIREIAWNSLDDQEKSTVIIDWTQAKVEMTTYNDKSAYSVIFNTDADALLGPITVYVDPVTKKVLGYAGRF